MSSEAPHDSARALASARAEASAGVDDLYADIVAAESRSVVESVRFDVGGRGSG